MQSLIQGSVDVQPHVLQVPLDMYHEGPDVVAAETVVTTTTTPRRRKQSFQAEQQGNNVSVVKTADLGLPDSTGVEDDLVSWQSLINTDTDAVLVETAKSAR